MRDIKTLLKILLQQVCKKNQDEFTGMCGEVGLLHRKDIITYKEAESLIEYIEDLEPENVYFHTGYYWCPGLKEPRIEWINKRIKIEEYE